MPTNNKDITKWSNRDLYTRIVDTFGMPHVKRRYKQEEEASKYTIPYIPEKEVMLTTGRYNTGKISTNLLDSIYDSSKRTGVPLDIALGLAGRESTLGIGRGFKEGQDVTATDLYSNWQQIQQPAPKSQVDKWNNTINKEKRGEALTENDYADRNDFLIGEQQRLEQHKPITEHPIDNALKFYQTGKYNPGDKNHSKMVEEDGKALMSDPAIQKWLKTKTGTQMKCGGRRKAQLGLDIREGGIAIPIANNMYYMDGRSHDNGGIAIGPNNKNGLEVEGGEVVKVGKNDVKVFSSVPLLRGVSPAQLVMGGANPNKVFAAQEDFKDRNRINDDGTRYEVGGEKNININNLPSSFRGRKIGNSYYQIGIPPSTNKIKSGVTGFKNYLKGLNNDLDEFGITFTQVSKKVMPKPLRDTYAKIVNAVYKTNKIDKINTAANQIGTASMATDKKKFGGSMIYEINGNIRNGLSLRPKAKYGLATKYLKKKDKTAEKPVEDKQKDEPKVLDIRNTAGYKIKQAAENPWVKYPVEVASYLLTGATAKGMQTGAKMANKAINKIDDILGKPRQEYLSRNISDKTISYTANSKSSVGNTYKATSKDLNRAKKEVQNRPTINDLAEARSTVGNVPQHTTISYNSSPQNPVSTINYFDVKNTRLPNIERFGRKQMDAKTSRELDKVYRKAVGNKEPKSGFGRVPQQTTIEYTPKGETITAYDASVEFHKRISDMLYDSYVKKYGKKGVDKAMKAEHISKYEYGGRIKAEGGKFLKYKNGIFTDPETGEEFEVDPEVFKMYGNTKESGVIPTADYTKGTFNARPQYYAEKRLPIAANQSIAEKAGLSRSGWSYSDSPKFDYAPNINISVPTNYAKAVGDNTKKSTSSTARGEGNKTSKSKSSSQSTPTIQDTVNKITTDAWKASKTPKIKIDESKMPSYNVSDLGSKETKAAKAKLNTSPTGGGTQSKNTPWFGQYKTFRPEDWAGLGTNLAGHIAGYFANNSLLKKYPMPVKPVLFQAAKLKTTHNINPKLATSRETEQMNLAEVGRNTSSSSTSLARKQRIMNEARDARNKLYGEKENIETQLINLDRRNRQDVYNRNISAYNDWLDKTYIAKTNKLSEKQKNIMSLISGIPSAVNHTLGVIENRRNTNNTLRAIAAANPNVDARQIGGFDYYEAIGPDGTHKALYDKHQRFVRYI